MASIFSLRYFRINSGTRQTLFPSHQQPPRNSSQLNNNHNSNNNSKKSIVSTYRNRIIRGPNRSSPTPPPQTPDGIVKPAAQEREEVVEQERGEVVEQE